MPTKKGQPKSWKTESLSREELVGKGLFLKRKASGDPAQFLKNPIIEWETLLEKLSWTAGIHQALLTSRLVYTQNSNAKCVELKVENVSDFLPKAFVDCI